MMAEVLLTLPVASQAGVVASYVGPAVFGVFLYGLVRRSAEPSMMDGVLLAFVITFALSFNMLVLAIFEIADVMPTDARFTLWRLDLMGLTVMLTGVLPGAIFVSLFREQGSTLSVSVVLAVVLHALYLYAYIQIGQFLPVASEGSFHLLSVEGNVERIGAVGIVTAAGLAGIGAVFTPFEWIAALRWNVWGDDLRKHRSRCRTQLDELVKCNKIAAEHGKTLLDLSQPHIPEPATAVTEGSDVREEHVHLRLLEHEFVEYANVREALERIRFFRRWGLDQLLDFAGYVLAMYSVYRVIMSSRSILFSIDPASKDPISRGIELFSPFVDLSWAVELVQPASLLLIAVLIFTSTRGFFQRTTATLRNISTGSASAAAALLQAFIMGTYFVSTVLLLRLNMPEKYRTTMTQAVGAVHFNFFHRLFDMIFVVAFAVNLVVAIISHQLRERERDSKTRRE